MTECFEKIIRLSPSEEAMGVFHRLPEGDGSCIADIGPMRVSLPDEIASKLKRLKGQ
jgi:hypothetical protein